MFTSVSKTANARMPFREHIVSETGCECIFCCWKSRLAASADIPRLLVTRRHRYDKGSEASIVAPSSAVHFESWRGKSRAMWYRRSLMDDREDRFFQLFDA